MSTVFRKDNLIDKIHENGIKLSDTVNWTNDRLIKRLGDYYMFEIGNEFTWGQRFIQSIDNIMLCHHLKDEKKSFPISPFEMDEFIAERKANGFRFTMSVDPTEGITLMSRRESVTNFLNGDFTNKVLFIKDGIIKRPTDFTNKFKDRFVIEGEITINNSESANFEGVEYTSIEDFIQAVLGSGPDRAIRFQKDGHELMFTVFDVLYFEPNATEKPHEYRYNYDEVKMSKEDIIWVEETFREYLESSNCLISDNARKKVKPSLLYQFLFTLKDTPKYDVRKLPFYKRRKIRKGIVGCLNKAGIPIREIDGEDVYKASYLDELLREGQEGIILKNIYAPYISSLKSSRSHRAEVKVKQTISAVMENSDRVEDFDVFITGANPPKSDRIKDMIGSLKCSIYLVNDLGETILHEIANVSGINHEWKRKLAKIDPITGEISLRDEYMDKVIPIDGLALTAANLKFQHAVLKDRGNLEFKPKNPTECTYDIEEVRKLVMNRGDK